MQNIYDELIFMGNNVLYAIKGGKAGLINGQGEIIADFIYDDLSHKYSNYYLEENWLDFEYFSVTKDCYSMSLNGKIGVKDYNNNTILDFIYDKLFVKTRNVKNFIGLTNNLIDKSNEVPKMGLVYGDPGLGKTQTAVWWATRNDG